MRSRHREVDYVNSCSATSRDVDIEKSDTAGFTTDHEGAVRNAARRLSDVAVGCACHGVQLPPRHVLPEVRNKKRASVDVESSSSDSTDDEAEAEKVTREEVDGDFSPRGALLD